MSQWTIAFDATVSISIKADTEAAAVRSAEKIVANIAKRNLSRGNVSLSVGEVFLIKNEETGLEIRK